MKGEYIVNAWNIVTLLVSTSWFQFQVFRSFIQTELIRKNLWNHHLEWKKRIFFYKWMLHTFYPPPQKKNEWFRFDTRTATKFSNASKPGTFFGDHPIQKAPAPHPSVDWSDELWFLQRTWKAQVVESTKAIEGSLEFHMIWIWWVDILLG